MRTTFKKTLFASLALLFSQSGFAAQIVIDAIATLLPDQNGHTTQIWSSKAKVEWNADGSIGPTFNSVIEYNHTAGDFQLTSIAVSGVAKNSSLSSYVNWPDDLGIDIFEADPDGTFDPVDDGRGRSTRLADPSDLPDWDTNDEYHFTSGVNKVPLMMLGNLENRVLSSTGSTDGSLTGPVKTLRFQFFEYVQETEDPDNVYTQLTFILNGEFVNTEEPPGNNAPEPSVILLMGMGLMGLGLRRRVKLTQ